MSGSVKIIEYLCHACGQYAVEVTLFADNRQWMCSCGTRWTGGRRNEEFVMLPIEERLTSEPAITPAIVDWAQSGLEAIREIPEFQRLAADLIHAHGINFCNDSGVIGASQLSDLVLFAVAYGINVGRVA